MTTLQRRRHGFTMVELMMVLAVIAILAAIAIPAYNRYGFRARRPDGQKLLIAIAAAEERYYALHNVYADLATIGYSSAATAASDNGYYNASVSVSAVNTLAGQAFTATATPTGNQQKDVCGALTLTQTGVKGPTDKNSNGNCW